MIIFREHPVFFLGLKYLQFLLSLLVVVFEITQYVSYGKNYVLPDQHNDWFDKSQDKGDSNGEVKIWLLVVCCLTVWGLVYNLAFFNKFWNNGFNLWFEIFFSALWLSAGLSNLDPVYRGTIDLNCKSPSMEEGPSNQFICNVWVTSVIFGWFIFGTFVLTTFMSWKLSKEIKEKSQWIKRTYPSDSYSSKSNDRKSFVSPRISPVPQPIVTIQNSSSDELEKGGVPELLLQSGLPADHRMSLRIVLPQSGPFGQSIDNQQQSQQQDEQPNEQQQQQPEDQTNDNNLNQINDDSTLDSSETFNSNLLVAPSNKSAEVSSLHEVPL